MIACFLGGLASGILIIVGVWGWFIGRHKRHKKIPGLTKYVIFSISIFLVYVIAEMIVSTLTGTSHPDLSAVMGTTFGGEIIFCALIKIFKLKEENRYEP